MKKILFYTMLNLEFLGLVFLKAKTNLLTKRDFKMALAWFFSGENDISASSLSWSFRDFYHYLGYCLGIREFDEYSDRFFLAFAKKMELMLRKKYDNNVSVEINDFPGEYLEFEHGKLLNVSFDVYPVSEVPFDGHSGRYVFLMFTFDFRTGRGTPGVSIHLADLSGDNHEKPSPYRDVKFVFGFKEFWKYLQIAFDWSRGDEETPDGFDIGVGQQILDDLPDMLNQMYGEK